MSQCDGLKTLDCSGEKKKCFLEDPMNGNVHKIDLCERHRKYYERRYWKVEIIEKYTDG